MFRTISRSRGLPTHGPNGPSAVHATYICWSIWRLRNSSPLVQGAFEPARYGDHYTLIFRECRKPLISSSPSSLTRGRLKSVRRRHTSEAPIDGELKHVS